MTKIRNISKLRLKYNKPILILGRGTYGKVTLHCKNDKMYAIKTFHKPKKEANFPADFLVELICLSRCNHPNVMKMIDYFCDFSFDKNDYFHIVMDLGCDNLAVYEPHTEKERKAITLQIISGLQHMANRGIVTGDLKLDNIIVYNDKVCISDFGLAQIVPQLKKTDYLIETVYTLYYRPLECLLSNECKRQSDTWALAVLIRTLFEGKMPFRSESHEYENEKIEAKKQIRKILACSEKRELDYFSNFRLWKKRYQKISKEEIVFSEDEKLNDLLSKMFKLIPDERLDLVDCYNHDFFSGCKKSNIEETKTNEQILKDFEIRLPPKNELLNQYLLELLKTRKLRTLIINNDIPPRIMSTAIHMAHRFDDKKDIDLVFMICVNLAIQISNAHTDPIIVQDLLNNGYTYEKIMNKTVEMIKYLNCDLVNTTYADYLDMVSKKYEFDTVRKANDFAMVLYIKGYDYKHTALEICNMALELTQEYYDLPIEKISGFTFSRNEKRAIYDAANMALKF